MKRLSPNQHGLVDYPFALSTLVASRILPETAAGRRLLSLSGLGATGLSLLTDYDAGVVRVVPMKIHLAVDAMTDALLIAAPLILKDEGSRMKRTLVAMGLMGGVVTIMTRSNGS